MSNGIITLEDLKLVIKRIKRRKGIESNSDISITMIAKELGYSRQTLYKRNDFDEVLEPFKKIKISSKIDTIKIGTKEYYKNISQEKEKEIKKLKGIIQKLKNKLIDHHVLEKNLKIINEKTERLQNWALNLSELKNENQALMKRNNILSEDNEMLRKKIMEINSFKLED
ncbi:hypothetical protein ACNSOP_06465 [Aliarcobacter lanthieri]|uniref:hypothetical protein n=1 Tax=Aliarcobacter lanthieri TaxID=1355374 RepID=UPI003AADB711